MMQKGGKLHSRSCTASTLPVPFPVAEEWNESEQTEIRNGETESQHKQSSEILKNK